MCIGFELTCVDAYASWVSLGKDKEQLPSLICFMASLYAANL